MGGQGGCDRRIEVLGKIQVGSGGRVGVGGQAGCERRIDVFVKIQKKLGGGAGVGSRGGSGLGVRVDVNEELKFLGKFTGGEGVRCGGSGWWGGGEVRMNVNAMLGVGGYVGYGGCEPRIEGIVQCTKRYCTILRK